MSLSFPVPRMLLVDVAGVACQPLALQTGISDNEMSEYMINDKLLITGYEGLEFLLFLYALFQLIVEYHNSQALC